MVVRTDRDVTMGKENRSDDPLLQTLLEAGDFGILALDDRGRILVWNSWLAQRTALRKEQVLGKTLSEALPGISPAIPDICREVLASGQPRVLSPALHKVLIPFQKPSRQTGRIHPVYDRQNRASGVVIIINDLSPILEYEQLAVDEAATERKEREKRFKAVFESANVGKSITELDGTINVNRAFCNMLGYEPEELNRKTWQELTPPDDVPFVEGKLVPLINGASDSVRFTKRYIHKNGSHVWADVSVAILRDDQGKPLHFVTTVVDISERRKAEEALRESEEKFRTLADSTPTAVMLYQDNRWVYANRAAEQICGYSAEELLTMNFWDFVHPDFKPLIEERGRRRQQGEPAESRYEFKIISKDGREKWVDLSGASTMLSGRPAGIISVLDVTDRKQAEAALRSSEENFRRSMDESPLGIRIVSSGGTTLYANRTLLDFYGYDSVAELNAVSTRERYTDRSYAEFLIRREKRKRNEADDGEYEIEIVRKNGDIRCLQVFRKEILWDGRKQYQVLYHDITEQKKIREALKISEERYRAFIKQSSEAICLFEIEHEPVDTALPVESQVNLLYAHAVIRECNRVFATSHGYPEPEAMIGFRIGQIFPRLARENVDYLRTFVLNGHHVSGVETKELSLDGSVKYFLNSLIGHIEGGKLLRVWGAKQDISRIKKAEEEIRTLNAELERRVQERTAQLEIANRELESFAYSVSHDLRAPLRAIDGYTQILIEDYQSKLDEEGKRVCSVISKNARNMGQLIDDLLSFSRFGRVAMQSLPVDMATLAKACYSELTTPEQRQRIDFQIGALPRALGDPGLIRQVWINLIGNAVKFSGKKERSVIEVGFIPQGGGRATPANPPCAPQPPGSGLLPAEAECIYFIRDNGIGYDSAYADKLFGVFQRLHSERDFEGTGVGLAIVQRIVQRHGGRVWAESEPGKGATFYFTLLKG